MKFLLLFALLWIVALSLWTGLWGPRAPHPTAVQRGLAVAEQTGCFACHGPGGTGGVGNAGHPDKDVPGFTKGTPMMYADSAEDVKAWIRDGITPKKKASTSYMAKRKKGALHMPDFKDRLSAHEIDDAVAYVRAVSGEFLPADSALDSTLTRGMDLGKSLGCTSCHGAMGAGGPANAGSLKGYVPGWNGADFPELVRDSTEFRAWVQDGVSTRFKGALAQHFLHGAHIHMPAYHDRVSDQDLKDLWAFIRVMRESPETAWAR